MTVLCLERFSVSCDDASLRRLAEPTLTTMRSAPGALWAELLEGFVLLSEWRTGADLDAWENSEGAEAFARALDPVLVGEVTKRRLAPAD